MLSKGQTSFQVRKNVKNLEDYIRNRWLNVPDVDIEALVHPMRDLTKDELDNPLLLLLKIIRDIDYVSFTSKFIFGITIPPLQDVLMQQLWHHPFPMLVGSRGLSKTFSLALYAMIKALIRPGSKIVCTGAGFRQSKLIFEYCETIWAKADILRDMLGSNNSTGRSNGPHRAIDRCEMIIGDSIITALPIGNGEKIRGLRAGTIITDEFGSVDPEIYETVIRGFTVVSQNPIENLQEHYRMIAMKELGLLQGGEAEIEELFHKRHNQSIISGTATYYFNHFAKYWKRYKSIIKSKGDIKKLEQLLDGDTNNMENLDYKDFCVMRIPVELVPPGMMDEKQIALGKATMTKANYNLEFGAIFVGDSDGFYKRSLIEGCVTRRPIRDITFAATIFGNHKRKYVYAIDPASESDRFAIIILELHEDHRRLVYCWTTTRAKFKEKMNKGNTENTDFYGYCARKIRDLMKYFPCELIVVDSQGGGIAISESLHDKDKLKEKEQLIWPVIEKDSPQDTDDYEGLHLIKFFSFASANLVSEANHGMKKDFEDKVLLFPFFDAVAIEMAGEEDAKSNRTIDTLEDCVTEIEELKDELATIQHSQTDKGAREHWDTPSIKVAGLAKKGRLRKDRYSALLMANWGARVLFRQQPEVEYGGAMGGFVQVADKVKLTQKEKAHQGKMYYGPAWFNNDVNNYNSGAFGIVKHEEE